MLSTFCAGTKVQILTLSAQQGFIANVLLLYWYQSTFFTGTKVQILPLSAQQGSLANLLFVRLDHADAC
jgi:hypothetical protein